MRPYGTSKQLEKRRRQAIALLKAGHSYRAVAAKLKSSLSSVVRWFQAYRKKGIKGLRPKPTPGRPPGLSQSQKQRLLRILVKGPLSEGYSTDLWTLKRIARVIEKHFGARYHPRSCMVVDDRTGVELSEAGTQSAGERRSGHCSLEEDHLATYKKKPKNLTPIWPFSMNPDFCSSPMFARPGCPWGKLPS